MIYKVGLGLYFARKKICFSSTDKYIGRIKVTLQEPQSIDQLVVPHRTVIRLGNEVLVITCDRPDGEAADWVDICTVPEWLSCWNGLMRRASSKPYG